MKTWMPGKHLYENKCFYFVLLAKSQHDLDLVGMNLRLNERSPDSAISRNCERTADVNELTGSLEMVSVNP